MIESKFRVHGIAVQPGISRNGILYTSEELNKFAPTMIGKPILKDHRSETDNAIGLVEKSNTPNKDGVVVFNGWIKDKPTEEKITDKRIKTVSIGAIVKKLVRVHDDDDYVKAIGLESMELSTTPTPGVRGTDIRHSLESIKEHKLDKKNKITPIFEKISDFKVFKEKVNESQNDNHINKKEVNKMTDVNENELREQILREQKAKTEEMAKLKEKALVEAKEQLRIEAEEKVKLAEEAKLKEEELKIKLKEEVKNELVAEKKKAMDIISEMKDSKREEVIEKLSESKISAELIAELVPEKTVEKKDAKANTKGKMKITKDINEGAIGTYVVEESQIEGFSLYKEPKADGSYDIKGSD